MSACPWPVSVAPALCHRGEWVVMCREWVVLVGAADREAALVATAGHFDAPAEVVALAEVIRARAAS